jgi:uncharacterized protein YegL/ribosomal protein L37AE/L43A
MIDNSYINRGTGERRLPIYFLIDTSGGMAGAPIEAVRRGLEQFKLEVQGDTFALETVCIGIITFGGRANFITKGLIPFDQFAPPQIDTGGDQAQLGEGLRLLIDSLDKDVRRPIRGGTKGDWRPLVFIFIGSEPTDDWKETREKILQRKVCKVITIGCSPHINQQDRAAIAIGDTLDMAKDSVSFHRFIEWPTIMDNDTDPSDTDVIPLSVQPDFINFGCLKPGSSAKKLLKVQGGPAKAITNNAQIRVVPTEIGEETTEIEITVADGEEGDLIWHSIQINGIGGKLEVPIIGYWDKSLSELAEKPVIDPESGIEETSEIVEPEKGTTKKGADRNQEKRGFEYSPITNAPKTYQPQERIYKAPVCPICRRNLHYDSNIRSWTNCEKCKSNVAVSLATRATEEGTKGLQDFKKTAKDFWDVLTGKQSW